MTHTVFIDGEAGTTGLQILERLENRSDLQILSIDPARRKDVAARSELLNSADIVILCLPDDAAREAVELITSPSVRVIDASTAHRTLEGWVYGFAEMTKGQREAIATAQRVGNPGCYATGAIALMRPLVDAGLLPLSYPAFVNGVSGYSGGGKGLIAEFEQQTPPAHTHDAFRLYGTNLGHKHLKEMRVFTRLEHDPLFTPSVGRFAQGMIVEVPVHLWSLPGTPTSAQLRDALADHYAGERFVTVASASDSDALQKARAGAAGYNRDLDPESLNGTNSMRLFVFGEDIRGQARLVAVLDNLGKGASGAAVQNLNLMLGLDEAAGLTV